MRQAANRGSEINTSRNNFAANENQDERVEITISTARKSELYYYGRFKGELFPISSTTTPQSSPETAQVIELNLPKPEAKQEPIKPQRYTAEQNQTAVRNPVFSLAASGEVLLGVPLRPMPQIPNFEGSKHAPSIVLGSEIKPDEKFSLATPELVDNGGQNNALLETWQKMHRGLAKPEEKLQREVSTEVRRYASSLGIKTYLHPTLDQTLNELASQTVTVLEERGAPLREAEYLVLVAEVANEWRKAKLEEIRQTGKCSDPQGLESIDPDNALGRASVATDALVYKYRLTIGPAYAAKAELCLPKLFAASGEREKREAIFQGAISFGDKDVFKQEILTHERQQINRRQAVLTQEIAEDFKARYAVTLQRLEGAPLAQINSELERLVKIYQPPRKVADELRALCSQYKLHCEDINNLWSGVLAVEDPRKGLKVEPFDFRGAIREAVRPEVTRIIEASLVSRVENSLEIDKHKRYQEWLPAFRSQFEKPTSEQITELAKLKETIGRFADVSKVLDKVQKIASREQFILREREGFLKYDALKKALVPLANDEDRRHELSKVLLAISPLEKSTQGTALLDIEIVRLLKVIRGTEDLRQLAEKSPAKHHQQIIQGVCDYLQTSGIDPKAFREVYLKELRATPALLSEDLKLALQAQDPVIATTKVLKPIQAALPAREYQSLVEKSLHASLSDPMKKLVGSDLLLVLTCLYGEPGQGDFITSRIQSRLTALQGQPEKLQAYITELKPEIKANQMLWMQALMVCKKAKLDTFSQSLIAEYREGQIPVAPTSTQLQRNEKLEALRLSLMPKDTDTELVHGKTIETQKWLEKTGELETRQKLYAALWELKELETRPKAVEPERKVPSDTAKSPALPAEFQAVQAVALECEPYRMEIVRLAESWGRVIPPGELGNGWKAEAQKLGLEEYRARIAPLYAKILEAEKKHGATVDLKYIQDQEKKTFTLAQTAAYLEREKGEVSVEQLAFLKIGQDLSHFQLRDMILMAKFKPLSEKILKLEYDIAKENKKGREESTAQFVDSMKVALLRQNLERLHARLDVLCDGSGLINPAEAKKDLKTLADLLANQKEDKTSPTARLEEIIKTSDLPFPKLVEELKRQGIYELLKPSQVRQTFVNLRGAQVLEELKQLHRGRTFLFSLAKNHEHEEAKAKLADFEKRIPELQAKLEEFIKDFPELLNQKQIKEAATASSVAGRDEWNGFIQQAKKESEIKEANKTGGERFVDQLEEVAKAPAKFAHGFIVLNGMVLALPAGIVESALTGSDPHKYSTEIGLKSHTWMNKQWKNSSAWGSNEDLMKSGNLGLVTDITPIGPLKHVIEEGFKLPEIVFDEACRLAYNSFSDTHANHVEFSKLQESDPLWKNLKRVYYVGEIGVSLYVIAGSKGAGTPGAMARIYRGLSAFGVSTGMSLATAVGDDLYNHKDFNWERVADGTLKGTAHSLLFSATMSKCVEAYSKLKMGKDLPKSNAELLKLQVTNPALYKKHLTTLASGMGMAHGTDLLDGIGDLAEGIDDLTKAEGNRQIIGAVIKVAAALVDTIDLKASGSLDQFKTPNRAKEAIKAFGLKLDPEKMRASENGSALYISDPKLLQDLWVKARLADLAETPGLAKAIGEMGVEALRKQIEAEAKYVKAFTDRKTGVVILPALDLNASRVDRVIATSWVVHELTHAQGLGEFAAWRAQMDYLHKALQTTDKSYQVEFKNGALMARELTKGQIPVAVRDSEITKHLTDVYQGDLGLGAVAAGKVTPSTSLRLKEELFARLERKVTTLKFDLVINRISELEKKGVTFTQAESSRLASLIRSWELSDAFTKEQITSIKQVASPYVAFEQDGKRQQLKRLVENIPKHQDPNERTAQLVAADWVEEHRSEFLECLCQSNPRLVDDPSATQLEEKTLRYWDGFLTRTIQQMRHNANPDSFSAAGYYESSDSELAARLLGYKLTLVTPQALELDALQEAMKEGKALPTSLKITQDFIFALDNESKKTRIQLLKHLGTVQKLEFEQCTFGDLMGDMSGEQIVSIFECWARVETLKFSSCDLSRTAQNLNADEILAVMKSWGKPNQLKLDFYGLDTEFAQFMNKMTAPQRYQALQSLANVQCLTLLDLDINRMMKDLTPSQRCELLTSWKSLQYFHHFDQANEGSSLAHVLAPLTAVQRAQVLQAWGNISNLNLVDFPLDLTMSGMNPDQIVGTLLSFKMFSLDLAAVDLSEIFADLTEEEITKVLLSWGHMKHLALVDCDLDTAVDSLNARQRSLICDLWLRNGWQSPMEFTSPALSYAQSQKVPLDKQSFRLSDDAQTMLVGNREEFAELYRRFLREKNPNLGQEQFDELLADKLKTIKEFSDPKSNLRIQLVPSATIQPGRASAPSFAGVDPRSNLTTSNGQRISANKQALYVTGRENLQALYIQRRIIELKKDPAYADKPPAELLASLKREAKTIQAFYDPTARQMILPQIDRTTNFTTKEAQEQARVQRVLVTSWALHENVHRNGGNEFDAWRAQMDYLHKALNPIATSSRLNGRDAINYQVNLVNGAISIQKLEASQNLIPVQDAEIKDHIKRSYGAELSSGRLKAGKAESEQNARSNGQYEDDSPLDREIRERNCGMLFNGTVGFDEAQTSIENLVAAGIQFTQEECSQLAQRLESLRSSGQITDVQFAELCKIAGPYLDDPKAENRRKFQTLIKEHGLEPLLLSHGRERHSLVADKLQDLRDEMLQLLSDTQPRLQRDPHHRRSREFYEEFFERLNCQLQRRGEVSTRNRRAWGREDSQLAKELLGIDCPPVRETIGSLELSFLGGDITNSAWLRNATNVDADALLEHLSWIDEEQERLDLLILLGSSLPNFFDGRTGPAVTLLTDESQHKFFESLPAGQDVDLRSTDFSLPATTSKKTRFALLHALGRSRNVSIDGSTVTNITNGFSPAEKIEACKLLGECSSLRIVEFRGNAIQEFSGNSASGILTEAQKTEALTSLFSRKERLELKSVDLPDLLLGLSPENRLRVFQAIGDAKCLEVDGCGLFAVKNFRLHCCNMAELSQLCRAWSLSVGRDFMNAVGELTSAEASEIFSRIAKLERFEVQNAYLDAAFAQMTDAQARAAIQNLCGVKKLVFFNVSFDSDLELGETFPLHPHNRKQLATLLGQVQNLELADFVPDFLCQGLEVADGIEVLKQLGCNDRLLVGSLLADSSYDELATLVARLLAEASPTQRLDVLDAWSRANSLILDHVNLSDILGGRYLDTAVQPSEVNTVGAPCTPEQTIQALENLARCKNLTLRQTHLHEVIASLQNIGDMNRAIDRITSIPNLQLDWSDVTQISQLNVLKSDPASAVALLSKLGKVADLRLEGSQNGFMQGYSDLQIAQVWEAWGRRQNLFMPHLPLVDTLRTLNLSLSHPAVQVSADGKTIRIADRGLLLEACVRAEAAELRIDPKSRGKTQKDLETLARGNVQIPASFKYGDITILNVSPTYLKAQAEVKELKLSFEPEMSGNGRTVFVSSEKELQQVAQQIYARDGAQVDKQQLAGIAGFFDKKTKLMFCIHPNKIDEVCQANTTTPEQARAWKIFALSLIAHEREHQLGGDERAAYRKQAVYLAKNGVQVRLERGRLVPEGSNERSEVLEIRNRYALILLARESNGPVAPALWGRIKSALGFGKNEAKESPEIDTGADQVVTLIGNPSFDQAQAALEHLVGSQIKLAEVDCKKLLRQIDQWSATGAFSSGQCNELRKLASPYLDARLENRQLFDRLLSDNNFWGIQHSGGGSGRFLVMADWIGDHSDELVALLSDTHPPLQEDSTDGAKTRFYRDYLEKLQARLSQEDGQERNAFTGPWTDFDQSTARDLFDVDLSNDPYFDGVAVGNKPDPDVLNPSKRHHSLRVNSGTFENSKGWANQSTEERKEAMVAAFTGRQQLEFLGVNFSNLMQGLNNQQRLEVFRAIGSAHSVDLVGCQFRGVFEGMSSAERLELVSAVSSTWNLNVEGSDFFRFSAGMEADQVIRGYELIGRVHNLQLRYINLLAPLEGYSEATSSEALRRLCKVSKLSMHDVTIAPEAGRVTENEFRRDIMSMLGTIRHLSISGSTVNNFCLNTSVESQVQVLSLLGSGQSLRLSGSHLDALFTQMSPAQRISLFSAWGRALNLDVEFGVQRYGAPVDSLLIPQHQPASPLHTSNADILKALEALTRAKSLKLDGGHIELDHVAQNLTPTQRVEMLRFLGRVTNLEVDQNELHRLVTSLASDSHLLIEGLLAIGSHAKFSYDGKIGEAINQATPLDYARFWQAFERGGHMVPTGAWKGSIPQATSQLVAFLANYDLAPEQQGLKISADGKEVQVSDPKLMFEICQKFDILWLKDDPQHSDKTLQQLQDLARESADVPAKIRIEGITVVNNSENFLAAKKAVEDLKLPFQPEITNNGRTVYVSNEKELRSVARHIYTRDYKPSSEAFVAGLAAFYDQKTGITYCVHPEAIKEASLASAATSESARAWQDCALSLIGHQRRHRLGANDLSADLRQAESLADKKILLRLVDGRLIPELSQAGWKEIVEQNKKVVSALKGP